MNSVELLTIYLTCGAPFAVYYLTQQRRARDGAPRRAWLAALLVFLFWMPYAFSLARRRFKSANRFAGIGEATGVRAPDEEKLAALQKKIEAILPNDSPKFSVYEFRAIFERYVGLTDALNADAERIARHEKEIYMIAAPKNADLAAICLHRRNRLRLRVHQNAAREDFLKFVESFSEANADADALKNSAIAVAALVKDTEALRRLERILGADSAPDAQRTHLKNSGQEKELWTADARKPPNARLIARSPILGTTMNLRRKD